MQISPTVAILQAISEAAASAAAKRTTAAQAAQPAVPAVASKSGAPSGSGKVPAASDPSTDATPNPRQPRGSLLDISA